jgi:thiol-disulfide isomerase/thioredoxin
MNTGIWTLFASITCILAPCAHAETLTVPIISAVEKTLPPIPYKDETGAAHTVEPTGNLTAVHFWATWCIPCLKELPEVDATAAVYNGLHIVTISLDTNVAKVKTFFIDKKIVHLPANLDSNNAAFKAAKLKGLPATIFLNEKGEVLGRADGPLDWKAKATTDFIGRALTSAP